MEILPLGADTDLGKAVRAEQAGRQLRRKLGILEDDIVVFTGGKLSPPKKTELLIEAVKRISRSTLHVVIVGDAGDQDAGYKDMLLDLTEGHSNFHFTGWLDRMGIYAHLDMCDLAVFPASQSILWQQAISMGLPLVVGDAGHQDISYLNLHRNIVILESNDIRSDKLAEVILEIVADPERMRGMSEGATKVADECLNWDKLIQKTLRFNNRSAGYAG
jgi:glycosyltransferase involved in cell wall biosynthesis